MTGATVRRAVEGGCTALALTGTNTLYGEMRRRGHTMALRGSAGNSLICYLLGITDVDPLRFGLEMERFLHPGRVEIIEYVIQRYFRDWVARISAHLFFQPRSACREAGKIHGLSSEQVSELLTRLDERVDEVLLPDPVAPPPPSAAPRGFLPFGVSQRRA